MNDKIVDLKAGLDRKGVSQRLLAMFGLSYTVPTLNNLASEGDGPRYRLVRGRAIYMPSDVDRWAQSRIGPVGRTPADVRRPNLGEVA